MPLAGKLWVTSLIVCFAAFFADYLIEGVMLRRNPGRINTAIIIAAWTDAIVGLIVMVWFS